MEHISSKMEEYNQQDHVIKVEGYNLPLNNRSTKKNKVLCSVLEKILANLGVISEVKVGDKLDTTPTGYFVIQQPTWYFSAIRFIKRLDRWQTYYQLLDVIGTAESIIGDETDISDSRVQEALVNAVYGLKNLQETYSQDITLKTNLKVLVERICINYGRNEKEYTNV